MKFGNMNVIVNTTTTRNVQTYHYSQPHNSTLGGLRMTQTTHDFVEWANPIRNPPQWEAMVV
jgi:hypothetical protein